MKHIRTATLFTCLIAAVLAICVSSESKAKSEISRFVDGNILYSRCKSNSASDNNFCSGYIIGIVDIVQNDGYSGFYTCIPGGVSSPQIEDIVVAWLEQRPQHRHYTAASITAEALSVAFPCKD